MLTLSLNLQQSSEVPSVIQCTDIFTLSINLTLFASLSAGYTDSVEGGDIALCDKKLRA